MFFQHPPKNALVTQIAGHVAQIAGSGYLLTRHDPERLCPRDSFGPFGSIEHMPPRVTRIAFMPPVGSIDKADGGCPEREIP